MLNIFICEDNTEQRKKFINIIDNIILSTDYDLNLKLSTNDPYELLNHINNLSSTGIYFLDIDLHSDINGIQLAEQIRHYDPRGFIVFITSHAEMSYLTFVYKVEAMDYIIKDNFNSIAERFKECIENAYSKYIGTNSNPENSISIKVDDRIINLLYDDILFFETSSTIHKIRIHCINRQIEFYGKMKVLESEVDKSFCRCHTSYLINTKKIKEIDKKSRIAYMINGEQCLISIRGLTSLLNSLS